MTHDESPAEVRARRAALGVLGLMLVIFVVLSGFSFLDSRGQITPDRVRFGSYSAVDGKRVFQAYNCMGCHTIVGNGAYLGPDLTREYAKAGPAWIAAFLPSAGSWPTAAALSVQLADSTIARDANATSLDAYYAAFPGARDRVERRGGGTTYMPNLPFTKDQVGALIAFLKYTSELNTEGWPPTPEATSAARRRAEAGGEGGGTGAAAQAAPSAAGAAPGAGADLAAQGAEVVKNAGCIACHSPTGQKLVGPGWGGLYGSTVKLADGRTVRADSAYLAESITSPDAKVVAGFPAGVMPKAYATLLSAAQRAAVIAYIRSLGRE